MLEVMEARIVWRIKANTQSWAYLREKIPFNLSLIYRSGLVDFLVRKFNTPRAIVLFGSFRQGQDLGGSDIDIAIQSNEVAELTVLQLPELKPLEAQIKRPIKIYLFNPRNIDLNLFNSIANGIVLYGFLEVRP
ncbi:MAG: nucleotidyltransferase domain-containing protein [Candidatus Micrarchaeia archaeon]